MNLVAGTGLLDDTDEQREEVSTMAATIDIEVESGTYTQPLRKHRGYYAGDFSARPVGAPQEG